MESNTKSAAAPPVWEHKTVSCHPEDRQFFRAYASANKMRLNDVLRCALDCLRVANPAGAEMADTLVTVWQKGAAK